MNASLQRPFGQTSDPRFLYREGSYAQVLADVTEGLRRREELILVSGAAGTGKSTLCNDVLLLSRLDRTVFPSMVSDPWLSVEELLQHILDACGIATAKGASRHELVSTLQRFLASLPALGARVWLIIDEAQHLRPELVEQLRLLSNGNGAAPRALQIVLVGQPEVEKLFESPQLDQRIARRCELKCLDAEETKRYIKYRLRVADEHSSHTARPSMFGDVEDAATDRFTPTAVREVAALSAGALRAIDMICDRALELASQRNASRVDRPLVREVARQLKIPARSLRSSTTSSAIVATALVAGLPPVAWFFVSQTPPHSTHAQVAPSPSTTPERSGVETLRIVPAISVEAGSFGTGARANAVAAQLAQSDLPASARPDFAGVSHVVIVGPYETDEEARAVQSTITEQGFPGARILHQQVFAPVTLESGTTAAEFGLPRIVAVTPDGTRVSLVVELPAAPARLATQRVSASVLEIEVGPVSGSIRQRDVTANGATTLLDRIALREVVAADGGHFLRARLTMMTASRSRVRMVGRRVYVDLSVPEPPSQETPREELRTQAAPRLPSANRKPAVDDQYREAAAAAVARFDEIQPFLLSAAAAPTPDVLRAVAETLSGLQSTLESISVPQSAIRDHALLRSAMTAARAAVQQDFAGDRVAKAREAAAMFEMAKGQSWSRADAASELTVAEGPRRPK